MINLKLKIREENINHNFQLVGEEFPIETDGILEEISYKDSCAK